MTKFAAILYDSFLEIKDRKIFYFYWAVGLVTVALFAFMPSLQINGKDLLKGDMLDPGMMSQLVANFFDGLFGFLIILLVFGSAGLIPSFLGKGRVELVLSKPIDRLRLLSMKFLGVYLVKAAVLVFIGTLVWITIAMRLGNLNWGFFAGLLLALLQFLAVYAIVSFLGVLTNSAAASIMGYFIIRIASDLLASRKVVYSLLGDSIWKSILDGLYHIMPKFREMSDNFVPLMTGKGITDFYPIWSTLLFSAVLFLGSLLYFNRKDY